MIDRLEFTKPVKLKMFKRAGGPENPCCEECRVSVKGKPFEYDHTIEEWEREDVARGLRPPLTEDDGKLLCIPCHDEKSGKKTSERAHVTRIAVKAAKAKISRNPMPGSKASKWKRKMDGTIVRRK